MRTVVFSGVRTNDGGTPEDTLFRTDLSATKNLTQDQLDTMLGDSETIIPEDLERPAHWPMFEGLILPPNLGHRPKGNAVDLSEDRLSLAKDEEPPQRSDLESLYPDLREAAEDLRDLGNLSNQSPLLSKAIQRFLERIPQKFEDLEQVRFGVGLQALSLQFGPEKEALAEMSPEKAGHVESVLLYGNLLAARLPEYQAFLAEEEDDRAVIESKLEETEAILEHAAEQIERNPDEFDVSLFERIREYLDDKSIEAYLASKNLLLNIAHRTFTLVGELLSDTVTEQRKILIKNLATALNVQLGAILLELAGLLPNQLRWLVEWLEFLPKIL